MPAIKTSAAFEREKQVKAVISKALRAMGSKVWAFMPVQTGFGATALDYLVCINGQFVAIETKAPKGKLTDRQQATVDRLLDAGAIVFVIEGVEQAHVWAREVLPNLVGAR